MRLDRVDIQNFRSIRNISLSLNPPCRILVGINEAGKTSILRALALLDPEVEIATEDIRDPAPDEPIVDHSMVRFIFKLDRDERLSVYESAAPWFLAAESNTPLLVREGTSFSLAQICDRATEGLYRVNLIAQSRGGSYWAFPKSEVAPGWFQPSPSCPEDFSFEGPEGSVVLSQVVAVHESHAESIPDGHLVPLKPSRVNTALGGLLLSYVEENLPVCIFWRHSEDLLIPGRINLDEFASDPGSCFPLMNAFGLAGVTDVQESVSNAKEKPNGLRNLLDRVAAGATKHIQDVWPEYKGITIDLRQNGDFLETTVNDVHNLYDFSRRSDGFQRFISFLLMISAPAKTNALRDVLILHDDPDAGLHPSGARHLRDELIRVSAANYVVFATHSIFMIDRDQIDRHVIVKKADEVTTISDVDESNFSEEEVIYNAMGFSMFEVLKERNIVFEGWQDKELFRIAMSRVPAAHSDLKKQSQKVGTCHVQGVKDVRRVAPMLELAGRGCLIVSDSDTVAKEHQRAHARDQLHGKWVRYDEVSPELKAVTAEDFVKTEVFSRCVEKLKEKYEDLGSCGTFEPSDDPGQLDRLMKFLVKGGVDKVRAKEITLAVKKDIFTQLRPGHVRSEYYDFASALLASEIGAG
jgi:hypothetical protein